MIGRVISGRYEVQAIVGTGGMAVVYRAWDRKNRRMVAIKVLRPEFEQDGEFVRRFSREAEAASKMSHENIVNLLDVGKDNDMRYIVMEYVPGQTLKEVIRQKGRIQPETAVRMAIRILAAVDHAHKNGIVHRDIKPQNILVDESGKVKVADFGIARLKTAQTTRIDDKQNSALGSVHYFSPEQASGEVADEKSDLYSMGVVLYEMLTGQVPFDGDTAVSVALKHVSEEPRSMREIVPSISRGLDEVVMRALAKDGARRYQTAAEFAGDLRKALVHPRGGFVAYPMTREEQERAREEKRRAAARRKRRLRLATLISAVAVGVATIGALTWYFAAVYNMETVPMAVGSEEAAAAASLRDRGFVVSSEYAYSEEYPQGLVIEQSVASGERRRRGTEVSITVSAGSQWVYFENMTGWTLEEVYEELTGLGFAAERVSVTYALSDQAVGCVAGQSPEPGWITRETDIMLILSAEPVEVPPLTGLTVDGARALAEAEGLKIGAVSEGYSADAPAGTVIAQSVASGEVVAAGTEIALTISQPRQAMYYPASNYTLIVPLDETEARLEIVAPSGTTFTGYSGVLDAGAYSVELSSGEQGLHTVREYMDGVLMAETQVLFE
ncbi:MAG TPA: protein kinase [Candidatus Pullichristensenella avicola]|nr:protein kinase [Candidatus Pullichristensenella avicola]